MISCTFIDNPNDPMYRNKNNIPDQSDIPIDIETSTKNENEEDENVGQQLQPMDVVIRLDDCMKCCVKIPRYQVRIE